ncbi:2-dehydropantoate 2-reductase [Scopulibacillus cellulosilyticus]|uniref:2-dehydropantoate 2-reductase n=1 Tax=Scopulibacillus cellulosilyticus TaxID=2665665 RepID=A0ABW2PSR4_9BACL
MQVSVIGGGSIGLLFAGYIAREFPTTLYVRRKEQYHAIKEGGIHILNHSEDFKSYPQVKYSDEPWIGDLIILAVKQPEILSLTETLNNKVNVNQGLMFIQNGMGHIDILENLQHRHIFLGVVEHGAKKTSDNQVVQNGLGNTQVAAFRGDMKFINDLLLLSQFPFKIQSDWKSMLIEKLIVNAVINPLTALYRVKNGQLIENTFYYQVMKQVFQETADVLCLSNPKNNYLPNNIAHYWDKVMNICKNTSDNRSSMLQDIEAGRITEIEAISGYIIKEADRIGKGCPLTQFLYNSILAVQFDYLRKEGAND